MKAGELKGKNLASDISGFVLIIGFGFIITAIINKYEFVNYQFSQLQILSPMVAFYALGRYWLDRPNQDDSPALLAFKKVYRTVLAVVALAFLAAIPALWWGVIKELSGMANKGKVIM
jgi:hypothetical protein